MNFILFTNQGYPLQNSSLGLIHSDRSVVSIVRSSAGRLLLVYLSGCRLCSARYYPKYQNGALSSGFWAGGIKRSHKDWEIRQIEVLRNHTNPFSYQKFIDGDCRVTWGVVVAQHPSAFNAWSHTCHPFRESFKDFPIKSLIDSLSWWHKFLVEDPLTVKKKWTPIWYWICSFSLSWDGESLQCTSPDFGVLSRGRIPESMIHHLW